MSKFFAEVPTFSLTAVFHSCFIILTYQCPDRKNETEKKLYHETFQMKSAVNKVKSAWFWKTINKRVSIKLSNFRMLEKNSTF